MLCHSLIKLSPLSSSINSTISASSWTHFWKYHIPHFTRIVWWRLLSNRIPTYLQHFFVFCPLKQRAWKIILEHCESNWTINEISTFISGIIANTIKYLILQQSRMLEECESQR
ncbi:hypothetical protein BDA99DRAFT_530653 [Phascolomyces articulosus]|uniref:Uncharacterized protein n=1 Tax=Phascolomyces articulosus TaxID=60185 RepID=A0AAD5JYQ9_9FUNG|nr:hypothetical protein BDA99DRAFT_530653 [Phascolomyces articulosus]